MGIESLLVELPSWIGDGVMATGAVKELVERISPRQLYLMGRPPLLELVLPLFPTAVPIEYRREGRWKRLLFHPKIAEIGVSFRSSLYSRLFLKKVTTRYWNFSDPSTLHMVEKYSRFVEGILNQLNFSPSPPPYPPLLKTTPYYYPRPTIGINPGATYGGAKRWYPDRFAEVANRLGKWFDVVIFGGPGEEEIAGEIEKGLKIPNYHNWAGKLTLSQLASRIGGLSLFITNDSGPMHIASALGVPVVAIFGPTDWRETSPWGKNSQIVRVPLPCSPCKKRECPLGTHECMRLVTPEMVVEAARRLVGDFSKINQKGER